jgi:hypothetical protein
MNEAKLLFNHHFQALRNTDVNTFDCSIYEAWEARNKLLFQSLPIDFYEIWFVQLLAH